MFTKTIKKYVALGLVLAVCSASSMAASVTKVLIPSQYQPIVFMASDQGEGVMVTGASVVGCGASPAFILLPILDSRPEIPADFANTERNSRAMDLISKAKMAYRPIRLTYRPISGANAACEIESVLMQ